MKTTSRVSADRATSWFVLGEALVLSLAAAFLFMAAGSALANEPSLISSSNQVQAQLSAITPSLYD